MSALAATPSPERMTVEQYLDWAEHQPEGRYELVDGVPLRMSPERNRHIVVKAAVFEEFREAVRAAGLDYLVLPDGVTVVINELKARGPDVCVVEAASLDLEAVTAAAPMILVEVSSPSTIRTDTGDKLIEYFSLPSVRHYLLVHPVERQVVHHRRDEDGTIQTSILGAGTLRFDPPGFQVEVVRFFQDMPPEKAH